MRTKESMGMSRMNRNRGKAPDSGVAVEGPVLEEHVIKIRRVSRKYKGGSRMGFSVLAAVGDRNGKVGIALAHGGDVRTSVQKAIRKAGKHMISVTRRGGTIPHEVRVKENAAKLLIKPAPPGAGIIAGGTVRSIVELAGITDISSKASGSTNPLIIANATIKALQRLKIAEPDQKSRTGI